MRVEINTTFTEDPTSEAVGQTTFLSSPIHSFQKVPILAIKTSFFKITGQEGLEPSTFGFGDRRSTIGATDLIEARSLPARTYSTTLSLFPYAMYACDQKSNTSSIQAYPEHFFCS